MTNFKTIDTLTERYRLNIGHGNRFVLPKPIAAMPSGENI